MTESTEQKPDDAMAEQKRKLMNDRLTVARRQGYAKAKADITADLQSAFEHGHAKGLADTAAEQPRDELFKAVAAAMQDVQDLEHTESNKEGGFTYATIDQFVASVRRTIAKHGLSVWDSMISSEITERPGANGKINKRIVCEFLFALRHESGQTDVPSRWTQSTHYFGGQSEGACHSFALKRFLKSSFLIATGDADDLDAYGRDPETEAPEGAEGEAEQKKAAAPKPSKKDPKAPTKRALDSAKEKLFACETVEALRETFASFSSALKADEGLIEYSRERVKLIKEKAEGGESDDDKQARRNAEAAETVDKINDEKKAAKPAAKKPDPESEDDDSVETEKTSTEDAADSVAGLL